MKASSTDMNTPSENSDQPKLNRPHHLSPNEIERRRKEIQERLERNKPLKEATEKLEKVTYQMFSKYLIYEPLKVLGELYAAGVEIDGYRVDIIAAQEAFKKRNKTLPIYPGTSKSVEKLIQRKVVAHQKGSFQILKHNNAMILTSDGKYFQINANASKQMMSFIQYDDAYFT